jgi:hypothetical protein
MSLRSSRSRSISAASDALVVVARAPPENQNMLAASRLARIVGRQRLVNVLLRQVESTLLHLDRNIRELARLRTWPKVLTRT